MLWLHACKVKSSPVIIYSPDNDIYNIGFPLVQIYSDKRFIIHYANYHNDSLFLDLTKLLNCLKNSADLQIFPSQSLGLLMQILYISTGCDTVSYFKNHSKLSYYNTFFDNDNTEFLANKSDGNSPHNGSLTDIDDETSLNGQLAFYRLVGCEYFKKYKLNLHSQAKTAAELYSKLFDPQKDQLINHKIWLHVIRVASRNHGLSEEFYIPSDEAIDRHWLRCQWVRKVNKQAPQNMIDWPSVENYGWKIQNSQLNIDWDSDSNIHKTQARVQMWSKGCKCTKHCDSNICGCCKVGKTCGPGCMCGKSCKNQMSDKSNKGLEDLLQRILTMESLTGNNLVEVDIANDTFNDISESCLDETLLCDNMAGVNLLIDDTLMDCPETVDISNHVQSCNIEETNITLPSTNTSQHSTLPKQKQKLKSSPRSDYKNNNQSNVSLTLSYVRSLSLFYLRDDHTIDNHIKQFLQPAILPYYQPVETTRDGNCLWHSISINLLGNEQMSHDLRILTAEIMLKNKDFFKRCIAKDKLGKQQGEPDNVFLDYLEEATRNGAYGHEFHILALAIVTQRDIYAYSHFSRKDDTWPVPYNASHNQVVHMFKSRDNRVGQHILYRVPPQLKTDLYNTENPCCIFYDMAASHYIALLPVHDKVPVFKPYTNLFR